MDAVSLLNKHADIARIMEHYGFDTREDGSMIRSSCAIHRGDNPSSFVANTESNLWFCHTQCGGGDMYTLVERMENVPFPQAVNKVAEILGVSISDLQIVERKEQYVKELRSFIRLMRDSKRDDTLPDFELNAEVKNVKTFRSFRESTLRHFNLGFCASVECVNREGNTYELHNRLVMPIHQKERIIGYSMRATRSEDKPKWSHQPRSIKTSDILYNLHNYDNQDVIVVVEGIFDVWAYHEIGVYAVCTYGAHLSAWQYKLLLRTGASHIILSYDGDEAGREATSKAIAMLKGKARLEYVPFTPEQDPESITREELSELYENRRHYLTTI
jgi:DNA primase